MVQPDMAKEPEEGFDQPPEESAGGGSDEEVIIMGYTVQPDAKESANGMYNVLFVSYDYRFQEEVDRGQLEWHPFMQDVRIEIPKRATDEEISAIIAEDMIVREQELRGNYVNDDKEWEEGVEKSVDNPSGLVGRRITGEK